MFMFLAQLQSGEASDDPDELFRAPKTEVKGTR
jgi:hypothetical protein